MTLDEVTFWYCSCSLQVTPSTMKLDYNEVDMYDLVTYLNQTYTFDSRVYLSLKSKSHMRSQHILKTIYIQVVVGVKSSIHVQFQR